MEHVLVHTPGHVPEDEQELTEHDQDPCRPTVRQVPREPQRHRHDPAEADVPIDVGLDRVSDQEERDHQQHADGADLDGARLLADPCHAVLIGTIDTYLSFGDVDLTLSGLESPPPPMRSTVATASGRLRCVGYGLPRCPTYSISG